MKKTFILPLLVAAIAVTGPLVTHAVASFFVGDNGYVGIRTSSPAHPLDVVGSMYSRLATTPSSVDWNAGNVQTISLTSSPTLTFSNGQAGGEYKLILSQDATGGRTVTWPGSVRWAGGTAPTLTATASSTDIASFVYDGTYYLGSFAASFGTTPSGLLSSLVSYWKLDGNSNDAVGGNNGTDSGIAYVTGKINNAADLDSSSDMIDIGNPSNLQITGPMSISFWFKTTTTNNTSGHPFSIINKADNSSQDSWLVYQETGTSGMVFSFCGNGSCSSRQSAVIPIPDTGWHHWVGTFDPNDTAFHVYLDGVAQSFTPGGTWSGTSIYNSTSDVIIGNKSSPSNWGSLATIDELGVWTRILSSTEVSQLYNSGSGRQYPF
jgi:hypothetical protein